MTAPWPLVPLGRVLSGVSRHVPVEAGAKYRMLGTRWYAGGLFSKLELDGAAIGAARVYRVEEGDLVYNRLFAWKGCFALADATVAGGCVSNEFPCFRADPLVVEPVFLKWFLSRPSLWDDIARLSTGSSTQSRLRLKESRFLALRVPLPPLSEQRRIVALLDQVARRVEEARRLSEQAASERETLLLRQVEELAKGAPRLPLSGVAPIVRRAVEVDTETWYPELGIRSFGKGTFHKPPILGAELGGKRVFHIEPGDLLFSNVFAWEGAIAVVQPEDEGRYGSHRFMTCLVDRTQATPEFLCRYFLTDEGMAAIRAASPGAAGRNRTLGIGKLAAIQVPVPPVDAQHRFADLADRVRDANAARRAAIEALDTLMPAALDRAFLGEL